MAKQCLLFSVLVFIAGCCDSSEETQRKAVVQKNTNKPIIAEYKKMSWVKDVFIGAGHVNLGVIRGAKKWDSPMIKKAVCSVLSRKGSNIQFVRFVDIRQIAAKKSIQSAQIVKVRCR